MRYAARNTIILLMTASVALGNSAFAQETSIAEGFAEGFRFNGIIPAKRTINADGSITYWHQDSDRATAVTLRQSPADPCVMHETRLSVSSLSAVWPYGVTEIIYNLRGITFELLPKHEDAPPSGSYFRMKGPRVVCEFYTGTNRRDLRQTSGCKDEIESTVEVPMVPILHRTLPRLREMCRWK